MIGRVRRILSAVLSAVMILLSPGLEAPRLFAQTITPTLPAPGTGTPIAAASALPGSAVSPIATAPPSVLSAVPPALPALHVVRAPSVVLPVTATVSNSIQVFLAQPGNDLSSVLSLESQIKAGLFLRQARTVAVDGGLDQVAAYVPSAGEAASIFA